MLPKFSITQKRNVCLAAVGGTSVAHETLVRQLKKSLEIQIDFALDKWDEDKVADIISAQQKTESHQPPCLLVVKETIEIGQIHHSRAFRTIAFNGRHLRISLLLLSSAAQASDFTPSFMSNLDYLLWYRPRVTKSNTTNLKNAKKVSKKHIHCTETANLFMELQGQHYCLVYDVPNEKLSVKDPEIAELTSTF